MPSSSLAYWVIVYNVPSRSGIDLAPRTLERLSELPNIGGMKDATGDIGRFLSIDPAIKARQFQLSGHDTTALPFNCGGHGTISVAANVMPRLFVSMHRAIVTGNGQAAIAIHRKSGCFTGGPGSAAALCGQRAATA